MKAYVLAAFALLCSAVNCLAGAHSAANCKFTGAATLGIDDGCARALGPLNASLSYQNPNMLNASSDMSTWATASNPQGTILQTVVGAVATPFHDSAYPLTSKINWNVPGLDYAVGPSPGPNTVTDSGATISGAYCNGRYVSLDNPTLPCSTDTSGNLTPLIDPTKYDWWKDYANTGCVKTTSNYGATLPYTVLCQIGSATMNINGFDWGPNGTCVGLDMVDLSGVTSGTVNFTDNRIYWTGDISCHTLPSVKSYNFGQWSIQPIFFDISPLHQWTYNIWRNHIEQNMQNAYNTSGDPMWLDVGPAVVVMSGFGTGTGQGAVSIKYNYFGNGTSKIVELNLPCNGFEFDYNVVHNLGAYSAGEHGEIFYVNPSHTGSPAVQTIQCTGFSYGSMPTSGWTSSSNWSGAAWGKIPYWNIINNATWTTYDIQSNAATFFADIPVWGAPTLLDIVSGTVALNVMWANAPVDGSGQVYTFMRYNWGASAPNKSAGGPTSSGGTGYNAVASARDLYSISTTDAPACAPGATPYSREPTVFEWSNAPTSSPAIEPADGGNCGYTGITPSNPMHLICVDCASASFPRGTPTGWTIPAINTFSTNVATPFVVSGESSNGSPSQLAGGFVNYESLQIVSNFATYMADYNAAYLSCSGGPIGSRLPAGAAPPFYSMGGTTNGTGNAHFSGNFWPNGSSTIIGNAFQVGNGC